LTKKTSNIYLVSDHTDFVVVNSSLLYHIYLVLYKVLELNTQVKVQVLKIYLSTSKSTLRKVYSSKSKKYLHFQSTFKVKSKSILRTQHERRFVFNIGNDDFGGNFIYQTVHFGEYLYDNWSTERSILLC